MNPEPVRRSRTGPQHEKTADDPQSAVFSFTLFEDHSLSLHAS
jgi:hypothetical protein